MNGLQGQAVLLQAQRLEPPAPRYRRRQRRYLVLVHVQLGGRELGEVGVELLELVPRQVDHVQLG